MTNQQTYHIASILVLAALLFLPVSKIIWTLSARRLQRKLGRELSEQETNAQLKRARFIALFLVILFSYLFNTSLQGNLYG